MTKPIILIRPNIFIRKGFDLQNKVYPPIGLAYLAGALRNAGHLPVIIDMVAETPENKWDYHNTHTAYGLTEQELVDRLTQFEPLIIGISAFTIQHRRLIELVKTIKNTFPTTPVVLGGIHASSVPDQLLEQTEADYVILGEGEDSLVALANAILSGCLDNIPAIDGIAYRTETGFIVKAKTSFINELDSIPVPARDLLKNEIYQAYGSGMPVITSRGCPYQCTFCCVGKTQGRGWRCRDPLYVVDEIEHIVKELNYHTITFFDDSLNIKPERLIAICQEIVRRKLNITILVPSSLVIKHLTKETLYWLKMAGCMAVSLPFEHSDETIRNKVIHKGLSNESFEQVLSWCRELEILSLVNFVIGMPGESLESLASLNEYVRKNAFVMDAITVYIGTPFPGTPFFDECLLEGYMENPRQNDYIQLDLYECVIDTPTASATLLNQYKRIIEKTFFDARGESYPNQIIRKAIRKPDRETIEYINATYFPKLCEGLARTSPEVGGLS